MEAEALGRGCRGHDADHHALVALRRLGVGARVAVAVVDHGGEVAVRGRAVGQVGGEQVVEVVAGVGGAAHEVQQGHPLLLVRVANEAHGGVLRGVGHCRPG